MTIEVLAPVGNMQMFYAALEAGADAVFLAGKEFGARAYASNFDIDEIKEMVKIAHPRGTRIHVTVNTLIKEGEMERALEFIGELNRAGVDAVIVQDLGLLYLASQAFPELEFHISTQVSANNSLAVNFLESLGASRVILARELSLEEIKEIRENTRVDLEVFGHGSLCVSYSGKCTMSSFIGARSGNRGRCAQPCRKEYELLDSDFKKIGTGFFLSPLDLAAKDASLALEEMGISSIKIEGRMKKPEYVYSVTKYYKDLVSGKNPDPRILDEVSNRGFTGGVLLGDKGKDFADPFNSAQRGYKIGNIKGEKQKFISLSEDIGEKDAIQISLTSKDFVITADRDYKKGDRIRLDKFPDAIPGSDAYKIVSGRLNEKNFEESFSWMDIAIDFKLRVVQGERPVLDYSCKYKKSSVSLDRPVSQAKNRPLDEHYAKKQLSKLGGTDFYLSSFELDTDGKSFLSASDLNELRRRALDDIFLREETKIDYKDLLNGIGDIRQEKLTSLALDKLDFSLASLNYDEIFLKDLSGIESLEGKKVYYELGPVIKNKAYKHIRYKIEKYRPFLSGIVVSNAWDLELKKEYPDLEFILNEFANCFNSYSLDLYRKKGADRVILSKELSLEDIGEMKKPVGVSYTSFARPVEMVMDYCPFSALSCDFNCKACPYSKGHYLKNRSGDIYRHSRSKNISYLKNIYPIDSRGYEQSLREAGVESFVYRIDSKDDLYRLSKNLTFENSRKGHLEKGVL